MEHLPYITPTTRILPVHYDGLLCVITSNDPYQDNGDYDWGDED